MRAANRGDQRAYVGLLRAITPVVRGIVRARGGALGPDGCEDIVQEVLLTIHLKRQTWREDAPLRPWLYAVTRHKVIDAFRARGSRIDLPVDDYAEVLPAPEGPDPFEAQDMDRVIGQLEPRAAQIVRAIGIDGDSAAETGARLGMSEGAVRVALHRALKSLARLRERMIE
ncbi:MAG: sigma-70 family RNA polymerase sigma factor [Rhodobacteraceae bacterium]|nr:sigma-70 family RNA polymerase sigma factor [Paracoccaceae bacterium]